MAKHVAPASAFSWALLALGLGVFATAGIGWFDHLSAAGEVVAGNVSYAGAPVGGATRPEVEELVSARARSLLTAEIEVRFGEAKAYLTMGDIGFSYDKEATTEQVMATRYQGSLWNQFSSWAVSGLATAPAPEMWGFDPARARRALERDPSLVIRPMSEPSIGFAGDQVVVSSGEVGVAADLEPLIAFLADVDLTDLPEAVTVPTRPVTPTVSDSAVEALTAPLQRVMSEGIEIAVASRRALVPPHRLREALVLSVDNGTVSVTLNGEMVQEAVERVFIGAVADFVEPVLEVRSEEIVVVARGEPPPVCCREGIGDWLAGEILAGAQGPFGLPTRPADDPILTAWADGSSIVEKVSELTTLHACCEARVRNIQRFADLVRGAYLLPGERLSLNEYVGPRTRENGFVAAGAIRGGYLVPEVGGGVSQFATTIFNAAYFAGLDFEEYQSHSVYFSRYPFGREATISSPAPDLVMVNTTDYPILIWTSYTDTSITVSMYSTKHIEVTEIGQRVIRRGACTHVETDRQRVYPDGRVVVDTIVADYRPAEGVDCSGNRIPRPGA